MLLSVPNAQTLLAASDPPTGTSKRYPRPWRQETTKLFVLITQKNSWSGPAEACGPHWGLSKHERRWKPASPSCSECAAHTPTLLLMSVCFCSWTTHALTHTHTYTHTRVDKHYKHQATQESVNCSHSDTSSPKCWENLSKHSKLLVGNDEKCLAF